MMGDTTGTKEKIVILGGGVGAMTAAFELTEQPNWDDKYEITVYQLGWRLGGKGASGRNADRYQRIEEHGLHVWFGFYENAFNLIRRCYTAAAYTAPHPFPTWRDAFTPQNYVVWEDEINGVWEHFPVTMPHNSKEPGSGEQPHTIAGLLDELEQRIDAELLDIINQISLLSSGGQPPAGPTVAAAPLVTNARAVRRTVSERERIGAGMRGIRDLLSALVIPGQAPELNHEAVVPPARRRAIQGRQRVAGIAREIRARIATLLVPGQPTVAAPQPNGGPPTGRDRPRLRQAAEQTTPPLDPEKQERKRRLVQEALGMTKDLPSDSAFRTIQNFKPILRVLSEAADLHREDMQFLDALSLSLRTSMIAANLAFAVAVGLIVDDVVVNGFDSINHKEFTAWLLEHGATQDSVDSALVRVFYCLAFAFEGGDTSQRAMAAGTGIRSVLRLLFDYSGSIMWKMNAGMGDTIFTPLYDVLKARGVKFEFFHRVKKLHLSGTTVQQIDIGRQVTIKPECEPYYPLVEVKDLHCWPDRPHYDCIVEGAQLEADQINLESAWTSWADVEEITLVKDTDFHTVVLGISLGALPSICEDLIQADPAWQAMDANVKSVMTQAFQLWVAPSRNVIATSEYASEPVVGAYVEPIDTYADMTHLKGRETWINSLKPRHIAYFCGPLEEPSTALPAPYTGSTPATGHLHDQVKATALDFLKNHIGHIWPNAVDAADDLEWDLLIDQDGGAGEARFDSQFWRANFEPSERYVLSVPGSIDDRIPSASSGFSNLYLAGDWTKNGLDAGCVEAAVMSGMQAARGITGASITVVGEQDSL